jgi:hypothetical protein
VKDLYQGQIKRVSVGDELLVHLVGMRTAGIFRVSQSYFHSEERIWLDGVYPHRVRFEPLIVPAEPVDIREFYYPVFMFQPRGYFRSAFREMPDDQFQLFSEFLGSGKIESLETAVQPAPVESEFALSLERDLEHYLEGNLRAVESGLKLFEEGKLTGRQFVTDVGRIDLLALDASSNFVVFELKAGEADRTVLGQILSYMGWVKEHLSKGTNVRGILIASDFSQDILAAANVLNDLTLYRYSVQFSFRRTPAPLLKKAQ